MELRAIYYCLKCNKRHKWKSEIGQEHQHNTLVSYKAGIEEVVKDMDSVRRSDGADWIIAAFERRINKWKARLKEWEIEAEDKGTIDSLVAKITKTSHYDPEKADREF